tara:strand:+ start:200 stop:655 length:456 start_codon:yes stop_codon:yes gene_type:complete
MKDAISNDLTNSLKSGEKERIRTLRLILAAIKDKEIASRSSGQDATITDENIIQILKKMVKQRNDSIEMFDKAGRDELSSKEKNEISIINEFLPEQLSAEETLKLCENAIQVSNAETIKEIGKVIKYLRENSTSSLDMALVSKILREKLQK